MLISSDIQEHKNILQQLNEAANNVGLNEPIRNQNKQQDWEKHLGHIVKIGKENQENAD